MREHREEHRELCRMRHASSPKRWWRIVRSVATGQHSVEWISDLALKHNMTWLHVREFSSEMLGSDPLQDAARAVLTLLVDQYVVDNPQIRTYEGPWVFSDGALTGEGDAPPVTLKPEYLELVEAARVWVGADKSCEEAAAAVSRANAKYLEGLRSAHLAPSATDEEYAFRLQRYQEAADRKRQLDNATAWYATQCAGVERAEQRWKDAAKQLVALHPEPTS